jgi:hypothetical protein
MRFHIKLLCHSIAFVFIWTFLGCATYQIPSIDEVPYKKRAQTQQEGDIRITAVVLSAEESQKVFGSPLAEENIQPIWLEVDNQTNQEYVLMVLSIDPNYFSPSEAAWKTRSLGERGTDVKIQYFSQQGIPVVFPPNSTSSGFVYTNFDPGAKAFAVELISEGQIRRFDFVLPVPGFEADFMRTDPENLYSSGEIRNLDLNDLRAYLESLPCCVLGGDRHTPGDPLNLVLVGESPHMLATFVRRGWDLTETLTSHSAWRTAMSSVFGSRYRTSPVSPLYLFDRSQDVALQKARATVDERNHLRLWRAPVNFQGTPVWVGQISRDIGVKLSSKTVVTHKIDPMVDEARLYVLLDIASSGHLGQAGYTKGVGHSSPKSPRYNYTDDPYYTDGLRLVLFLTEHDITYDKIQWYDWEVPAVDTEISEGDTK